MVIVAYPNTKVSTSCMYHKKLSYLEGDLLDDYLNDMRIVQKYAEHNRRIIANRLVNALGVDIDPDSEKHSFTTIHNYIDTDKRTVTHIHRNNDNLVFLCTDSSFSQYA